MATQTQKAVDINKAELDDLVALPGIGPSMAERIVAGRPYQTVSDLQKVKGLGAKTLDTLRKRIIVPGDADEEMESNRTDAKASIGNRLSGSTQRLIERMESLSGASLDAAPSSTQVLGIAVISGILSVIFSVILSLAILAGINRTLNIARHSAVLEINGQMDEIESQLSDLAAVQTSLDQRLQAVEGLSGRMTTVEAEFDEVQEQVLQMSTSVDQLSEQVGIVSEQMQQMVEQVNRFDAFLNGVRDVISNLFEPAESTVSPQE
jgi:competence protein ComEA